MMRHLLFALLLLTGLGWAGGGVSAEEAAPAEDTPAAPQIGYYTLKEITTNASTLTTRDKIHYVRVKVSIMVNNDQEDLPIVKDYEPVVRDLLITLIGSKEYADIAGNAARENLRVELRTKLTGYFTEKFDRPVVEDVLFLNYVFQ